jgi:DNA-directed RNA polymerase subunit RPC12/RpoP
MKCALCGHQFEEKEAQTACAGCPVAGACHMIRCPNCGYDMPAEPKLVKVLQAWRRRKDGDRGKS